MTQLVAADPTTALDRHLAALRDPAAGEALYDSYARDAILMLRGDLLPRHAIDRAEFAWSVAALARLRHAQDGGPSRPAIASHRVLDVEADGDRAVIRFEADEAIGAQVLTASAGLVREADGWKVAWATLHDPTGPDRWAVGEAASLADGPMAVKRLGTIRSWLDAAYYRVHLKPRPPLNFLPEARFKCQSSTLCCDISFKIEVDPSVQPMLDAMPWATIEPRLAGVTLPAQPNGKLLLKAGGQGCQFLDKHKHCLIHKTLGRQPLPVCAEYPIQMLPTPDGVDVALSSTCPSARAGIGPHLSTNAEDLYDRLLLRADVAPETIELVPGQQLGWPAYREAEAALLALLDRTDLPLLERLLAGERLLHRLLDPADAGEPPPASDIQRAVRRSVITAATRKVLNEYTAFGQPPKGLDMLTEAVVPQHLAEDIRLSLRSFVFNKRTTYDFSLLFTWHTAIFWTLHVLQLHAAHPDGIPPLLLRWSNTLLFHRIMGTIFAPGPPGVQEKAAAFSRPAFGFELLDAISPPASARGRDGWWAATPADMPAIEALLATDPDRAIGFLDSLTLMREGNLDFAGLGWLARWAEGRCVAILAPEQRIQFVAADPAAEAEAVELLAAYAEALPAGPDAKNPTLVVPEALAESCYAAVAGDRPPTAARTLEAWALTREGLAAPPEPGMRVATAADLPVVAAMTAADLCERYGLDVVQPNEPGFQAAMTRRIEGGRVFLLEEGGAVRFTITLGQRAPAQGLAELVGAFTPPAERDADGAAYGSWARRGFAAACALALDAFPRLLIMLDRDDPALRSIAEAAGFRPTGLVLRELGW